MARTDRRAELFAAALIPYTAAAVALILRNVARRMTRVIMFLGGLSCHRGVCKSLHFSAIKFLRS